MVSQGHYTVEVGGSCAVVGESSNVVVVRRGQQPPPPPPPSSPVKGEPSEEEMMKRDPLEDRKEEVREMEEVLVGSWQARVENARGRKECLVLVDELIRNVAWVETDMQDRVLGRTHCFPLDCRWQLTEHTKNAYNLVGKLKCELFHLAESIQCGMDWIEREKKKEKEKKRRQRAGKVVEEGPVVASAPVNLLGDDEVHATI